MPTPPRHARIIRFGLYEADLAARELRRDGLKVKLQDRPFEVLTILLERPGEVVRREELRQRLWPADTFVDFDPSLNTSINKLRQALSDDAENPRFIATVGRRGYRFIAPTTAEIGVTPAAAALPLPPPVAGRTASDRTSRTSPWVVRAAAIVTILIASLVVARLLLPEPTPKVLNVVQLSHGGHLDPWGRLTTDGARVFFLARAGGHWNLMQVPAAGGEAEPFPEPSQNVRIVDISADRAEFLSFQFSARAGDLPLSLTPVVGGPRRRVGNIIADDAVFAPGGRRISFTRPDGIYSCERDGSQVKRLVALEGRSENPRWSKDGHRLRFTLFDRNTNGSSIWEVSADGSNLHPVLRNWAFPGEESCGQWSSDGRYFFFESVRDGVGNVWAIRESKRSWFSATPKPVQLTFGPRSYGYVLPDGERAVFVWSGTEEHELVRYDRNSHRVEPLLPDVPSFNKTLSPDGLWLAFSIGGTLWRSRTDGSQRESLVSGLEPIDRSVWSPDGKSILFHKAQGTDPGKVYVVPADGGTATELPLGTSMNDLSWSPDGQSILFAKRSDEGSVPLAGSGIYSLGLRTSQITKIPGSEGLIHPNPSPDRRFVAAVTNLDLNPNQPTRLKLFDSRTQTWKEIARGTLLNPTAWSGDSRYFYYQDILGPEEPVFRFGVGAQKPELLFDFASLLRAGYHRCAFVGFDPRGDVIAYLARGEADLYRLDLELP